MNEKNYFSKNLKFLRSNKKMTQAELSNRLGVDQTTIGRWEDGNREPTVGNVLNISKIFNIDVDTLLNKDLGYKEEEQRRRNTERELISMLRNLPQEPTERELLMKCIILSESNRKKILDLVNLYLSTQTEDYERLSQLEEQRILELIDSKNMDYNIISEEIESNAFLSRNLKDKLHSHLVHRHKERLINNINIHNN